MDQQPVITHRVVESPLRIQRTDKATRTEHVVMQVDENVLFTVLCTIDTNLHYQYLIEIEGEKIPVTKWINDNMKFK